MPHADRDATREVWTAASRVDECSSATIAAFDLDGTRVMIDERLLCS